MGGRKQGGRRKKSKARGHAAHYMTRNQALRRLQVPLAVFRRLCILKGVHPRAHPDPKKPKNRVYYHEKDILFMMHEPVLDVMRKAKSHGKKIKRARGKKDYTGLLRLLRSKPHYSLHHIVRERYPTFVDAIRDLDDALCLIFLFAALPQSNDVSSRRIDKCVRIAREFQQYVIASRSLRRVFLSIKGIYYEAEILGQSVVWVVPYAFTQQVPDTVNMTVLTTFLSFYETLLKFVLFRLYKEINIKYPPALDETIDSYGLGLAALTTEAAGDGDGPSDASATANARTGGIAVGETSEALAIETAAKIQALKDEIDAADVEAAGAVVVATGEVDDTNDDTLKTDAEEFEAVREGDDEDAEARAAREKEDRALERLMLLFEGEKVFLSREVPKTSLEFVISAFGGTVSTSDHPVPPFTESDESVTYQIVDRNRPTSNVAGRAYVQPQWVYDSVNAGILLPVEWYAPAATLPPHLSPFVNYGEDDYVPEQYTVIQRLKEAADGDSNADGDSESDEDDNNGRPRVSAEELYAEGLAMEAAGVTYSQARKMEEEEAEDGEDGESARSPTKGKTRKRTVGHRDTTEDDNEGVGLDPSIMMPRKKKRLYERIQHSKRTKKAEANKLRARAAAIKADAEQATGGGGGGGASPSGSGKKKRRKKKRTAGK